MNKVILVTGGTGKTGRRVVEQLKAKGYAPKVGTRSPRAKDHVRFDWKDVTTFGEAFRDVEAVYLVAPTDDFDSLGAMQSGLDAALAAGVRRFVLLSASSLEEGGPMMGAEHAWLRANAPEWSVLRPSWFMQNFSENQHLAPIRDEAALYTATEDGRAGFIDAEDIAACAVSQLVASDIENRDHILTGPNSLSYDEVATALSKHLGKAVTHQRLGVGELARRYEGLGLPKDYAEGLANMDVSIAAGSEDRTSDAVECLTGRKPASIDQFVERNLPVWQAN